MQFRSTATYVASPDLAMAVNAAVTLERPLLVKGEPGTGKTELARQVAASLDLPIIEWNIKSTTKAQQGLYEYDAVSRLRDSQLGDARVNDVANYIRKGKLWDAFTAPAKVVLLIDEIDKADIEFPNDLLQELDRMEFHVYETGQTIAATHRPVVIITSNNEKELPDAFLRRCFFHYIRFPDADTLKRIVDVHHPGLKPRLLEEALSQFLQLRDAPGLKKKPSTSELLDWLKLILAEDLTPRGPEAARGRDVAPPARRAAEERTGCGAVRAAGVHGTAAGAVMMRAGRGAAPDPGDIWVMKKSAACGCRVSLWGGYSMSLNIRAIAAGDAAQWQALYDGYQRFYDRPDLPQAFFDQAFERLVADDAHDFHGLVAEQDGQLLGLAHYVFHPHLWRPEGVCYLQDLFTAKAARGKGVGRALIGGVYDAADAAGVPAVYWMTQEFNYAGRMLYDQVAVRTPFIRYSRAT